MRTALKIAAFAALMSVLIALVIGCDEFGKAVKMSKEKQNPQNEAAAADPQPANEQTAYFAAGCFWGVEAAFRRIEGVTGTAVGYMGGHTPNPTYKQVCSNRTGHAETVRVRFDPQKVTYEQLLDVFWSIHDPTTPNRQGPDVGSQYRSAIFVDNETHYRAAVASRLALTRSGRFARPIVTEIKKAGPFYLAEEYHQHYLEKQGKAACTITPQ
jgi:peptide-methionine (S)-S-oxide reductase